VLRKRELRSSPGCGMQQHRLAREPSARGPQMTDPAFAAQLLEDIGPAGMRAVAAAFQDDLARLVAVMDQARAAGDIAGFRRAAHGLAGAAGTIGATALERACRAAMAATTPAALPGLMAEINACAGPAARDVAQMLTDLGLSV
jgi:HPt (histidine-containing phosphotransfer) domain-containing protein